MQNELLPLCACVSAEHTLVPYPSVCSADEAYHYSKGRKNIHKLRWRTEIKNSV